MILYQVISDNEICFVGKKERRLTGKYFSIYLHLIIIYITDSVRDIEEAETRILGSAKKYITFLEENKSKIKAAIFYSVVSTQKGLQVVNLKQKF